MTVRSLALSARALRENARSRGSYVLRGLLVVFLVLMVWIAHEQAARTSIGGEWLMVAIAWGDFGIITLLGVSVFAATITDEKELLSLGLLRLAGFTPASIILGKSIGLLLNALLLLIVQLPFCMLAVTLGGVSVDQVFGLFGMLGAYLLFVYGLAILASVVFRRTAIAARTLSVAFATYFIGPWICLMAVAALQGGGFPTGFVADIFKAVMGTSVTMQLNRIVWPNSGLAMLAASWGWAVGVNLVVGVGAVLLAWLSFDRFNRNESPPDSSAPRPTILGAAFRGPSSRQSLRPWRDAIMWKDYQFFAGGKSQMVWRTVSYLVLLLIGVIIGEQNGNVRARDLGPVVMWLSMLVIILELGIVASRMFSVEIQERTLGSLIALPSGLGHLIWSKVKGCSLAAAPAAAFFVFGLVIAPEQFADGVEELADEPGAWYFLSQVVLFLFLTTYLSLRVHRGAFALSLVLIVVCNLVIGGLVANIFGVREEGLAVFGFMVTATLVGCLCYGITGRLRTIAADA